MLKDLLRKAKQEVFHWLRLYPVYKVVEAINKQYPLKGCHALEAFAFTGAWQTRAFKKFPAYLEAWELDPACLPELKKNLPGATIKITDSFEEVKRTTKKFDFINVDTHQGLFGDYCENFEFYPLLFRIAAPEVIVNLNVMPSASAEWRQKYPDLFIPAHLEKRRNFYGVTDAENIPIPHMIKVYERIAKEYGYDLIWHYTLQRTLTHYLVLHLKKR